MIHIGHVLEQYMGETKTQNKVRIGWELPTETRVFKEEKGEQPFVFSKEFTLSMHEKSTLRKVLASWRGKDFTEDEAKAFDITKLIGAPCMLNIIHTTNKEGTKTYEQIASITPMPKGFVCPDQINPTMIWDYSNPDWKLFESLPDFIKDKIKVSEEYARLTLPQETHINSQETTADDVPF